MNDNKSPQNRYCCVPLCSQKGSTGPNGEKVGFFSIPAEKDLREQWLHAIRRDTGKHFSVTEATKVCSLHFKKEEVKKSLGIGRFSYVDGAVPSFFAWKRSSPRKRPTRGNGKKARSSLDMSAVSISSSEAQVSMDRSDSNIDFIFDNESASATSENASCTSENRLSYYDLQKRLSEMKQVLEDSQKKNEKLEAEVEKVRAHAFKLSEKCSKLERRIFSSDKFISDEDIAFYTGFPSYAAFMATYTYLNPGENGENIRYWRSV